MSDKKIRKLDTHVSDDAYDYVERQATAAGISKSAYLRELIAYAQAKSDHQSDPVLNNRIEELISIMAPGYGFEKKNERANRAETPQEQQAMFLRCVTSMMKNTEGSLRAH